MRIYTAIKERTPWSAFFMAILFSPIISMLYLNRGFYALGYVVLYILFSVTGTEYFAQIYPISPDDMARLNLLFFTVIGAAHSVQLARNYNKYETLRWYAKIIPPITVTISLLLIVFITIKIFLYELFHIPSGSMEPNYIAGDMVFISKTAYGYSRYSFPLEPPLWQGRFGKSSPKRGDTVIFAHPNNPSVDFLKRIIGMPGDTVQMKNGTLYINERPVEHKKIEPYQDANGKMLEQYVETLPDGTSFKVINETDTDHLDNTATVTIPDNHYFVMGDNRDNSWDSRVFGPVHEDFLIGPVVVKVIDGRTNGLTFQYAR